jgi:hypothetical protein
MSAGREKAENAVTALYRSLSEAQKKVVCLAWDHHDPQRGLLRGYVSNFWHVSKPMIGDPFYSSHQRALLFDVFRGAFNPDWQLRMLRQVRDDHSPLPWGGGLSCGFFGEPGSGRFQFVLTGRHITVRVDAERDGHLAFGGPILHGHAPIGAAYREGPDHPGNVFWHQARLASKVYTILDGKQQRRALVAPQPRENAIAFRGREGAYPGLRCAEMSSDQQAGVREVLLSLIEPYHEEDRQRVLGCLDRQGGLERCSLAFYPSGGEADRYGWENWRLEGPAFVWYFRGCPHTHIWINVADDPAVAVSSRLA